MKPLLLVLLLTAAPATEQDAVSCEDLPLSYAQAFLYPDSPPSAAEQPLILSEGPHLFVDDYLVESTENIVRVVNQPERDPALPNPAITGKEDGCFQPYLSVLRDPDTGRFRIWFGHRTEDLNASRSRIGYTESDDGIHWERPVRVLEDPGPIQFGVSVIDHGPAWENPAQRFKFGWYMDDGLRVASSPDGIAWKPLVPGTVLRHNHDINGIFYDPLRRRYVATLSVYREGDAWEGKRRITMQSHSPDLIHWSPGHHVLLPRPEREVGEVQFYAMDGFLQRGGLTLGMVKVLRDDLKADNPPAPPEAYGIGYTALAWTRNGETWVRDPAPFFERDLSQGAWDHSHAWIDEQVPVEDEVYLYYGGYAHGHKVNRFEERQIGLVKMKKDRYVARQAGHQTGTLRTPLLRLPAGKLHVNVAANKGMLRVRLFGKDNAPIPGFDFSDHPPIQGDLLNAPIRWKHPLAALSDQPVRLEFELTQAALYAFYLEATP